MLYLANAAATPEQLHGAVVLLEHTPFAPSAQLRRDAASGAIDGAAFTRRYVLELRALWRAKPAVFRALIGRATGGQDVTLMDAWRDEPHAPRKVLASVLRQIARADQVARHPAAGGAGPRSTT